MCTYSLEDLLPSDVVQSSIQVLDTCRDVLNLVLVAAFDLVGLTDNEVKRQLDTAVLVLGRQPAWAAGGR